MTRARLLTALLLTSLLITPATATAQDSWLDAPLAGWNTPGGALPVAPPADPMVNPRCADSARPPETDQDAAVAAAGWRLSGPYQGGWGIMLVLGAASFDGMCRPVQFNQFVFVDGQFAGTVSPTTMTSRLDGVGAIATLGSGTRLSASFARYAAEDPLCCPSGNSFVQYRIDRTEAGPVLVPLSATTQRRVASTKG